MFALCEDRLELRLSLVTSRLSRIARLETWYRFISFISVIEQVFDDFVVLGYLDFLEVFLRDGH